jgi:DNA-binding Lrp family transcriptional regulator
MKTDCTLDRLDLRILTELQKCGRITNVELANAVGLSASPCLTRVKRLEKAGFIAGYGALVRVEKLGDFQVVFTKITLADHRRDDFVRFVEAIRGVDEIMECHHATGGYDYLLKFVTRNVIHYQSVMEGLLERDIGIEKYFSYVIINSPIARPPYSLETLFGAGEGCSKRI